MSKRTRRSTPQQFEAMVQYMSKHPHLINGKLSSTLTCAKRLKMWEELASTLNDGSLGPKKTVHQWRRAWIDLKSEVKEKLGEQEVNRRTGKEQEILNPSHQKVAHLLTKVAAEVELNEKHLKEANARKALEVKLEECGSTSESDNDNSTPAPFVVSLVSLNQKQDSKFVKNEDSVDSSNSGIIQEPQAGQSKSENELSFSNLISAVSYNTMDPKVVKRKRYRKTEIEENEHLNNLVIVEKEKSEMLSAIAHALSTTNENEEKRLKVEQERNRLIQERNAIENERNELFKAFLEHIAEKDIL